MSPAAAPRSLAEDLRARGDEDLQELFAARTDLVSPLPSSTTALATRAATRTSTQRALDRLDTPTLQVAEVLAVLPDPVSMTAVSKAWGARANDVVAELRTRALVWGPDRSLHLISAVRELLGPHPAGLGPPLAEALGRRSPARLAELLEDLDLAPAGDPDTALTRLAGHLGSAETVRELLTTAPAGVEDLLEKLSWGPPTGAVERADRQVRAATSRSPVDWLLAHGLLAVAGPGTVVLPREVGLALRGNRVHREPQRRLPALGSSSRRPAQVAGAGAEAAADAVRLVDELGRAWGSAPPPVLRAGGLGVRELRRTATALEVDEATAALVVETAWVAGLVADDGEVEPRWLPTLGYDVWAEEDVAERWSTLVNAWLGTTRVPALVGTRDAKDAARNALGPDLDRPTAPAVRAAVLAEFEACPTDEAPVLDDVLERLRWRAPRRSGRLFADLVRFTVRDAGWLGLLGAGALTPAGRALLEGDEDAAVTALRAALPKPVEEILVQADLTAVAPGPLVPEVGRRLELLARVESRGGATVYRFDDASVRRGLDEGMTADGALEFLTRISATGVPQPLEYLVRDVARRHGRVRVGRAGSYIRAEDPSVLAQLLSDKRCAALGLRSLAPTVLVASAEGDEVLTTLRAAGLAPAAEGPDGELLLRPRTVLRSAPRPLPRPVSAEPPPPAPALVSAAVKTVRAGDADADRAEARRAAAPDAPRLPALDPSTSMALLREAAAFRQVVWIGFTDRDGAPHRSLVEPIQVEGGRITAFDRTEQAVHVYSVHRVTGVVRAPGETPVREARPGPDAPSGSRNVGE